MRHLLFSLVFGLLFCVSLQLHGQLNDTIPLDTTNLEEIFDTVTYELSLKNVIALAIKQSSATRYAQNTDVNAYWRYKNFLTRFRPQLVLSGDLPKFENTNNPITQPDGSIKFQRIQRLSTSADLSLNHICSNFCLWD